MAVIGADDLEAGTHIFVKLRPCTIRKSTRHCPGRECHFESERQDVMGEVCPIGFCLDLFLEDRGWVKVEHFGVFATL